LSISQKKNNHVFVDALSCLDIDCLKIQVETEEALTILSGSENSCTSNTKLPMHTALIFKEQTKVKDIALI
jgi:hypothetical protein